MSLRARLLTSLRRLKPAWAAYNLPHWRRLRENATHYRRLGLRRSVLGPISHRTIVRASGEGDAERGPWLDRPDAAEALAAADPPDLPESILAKLPGWIDGGFLVLERYFDADRIAEINTDVDRLIAGGEIDYHYRGNRILDAHRRSEPVLRAFEDPTLMRLFAFLLGRPVSLFQTITFLEGSQQPAHSDSFHMTTEPLGYLIAAWVALEDVAPDSGPVSYYPGSHRLPYVMSEDLGEDGSWLLLSDSKPERYAERIAALIERSGIEAVSFEARAGDVLVWHANLLHGGMPVERAGATRRSLVAHYFADGVLRYHEVTERLALIRV